MAGGKETPRQKLIGLMYLVFLAMLALQVSSAIMQKFIFLDDSLGQAAQGSVSRNMGKIDAISKKVEERGGIKSDLKVLDQAKQVREKSKALITYIDGLRDLLIEKTGGIEKNDDGSFKGYKGGKEEGKISEIMITKTAGPENSAEALKKKLDNFHSYITSIVADDMKKNFAPLAMDGKEHPLYKNDKEQKNKTFAELNFAHTPLVAALAVMNDMKNSVANYEALILNELAAKVGAADFKFDKLVPMYRAESRTVAAGTKYKAEMFVAATSSKVQPTMKYGGREIEVKDGVGVVEFTAKPGKYDKEGKAEKTWEGKITMPNPTGGDTTFTVKGEYVVAKPVIQVQSASVSALYKNCGNELNVQVPALGSNYNPSFSASGARTIKGAKKGLVTVVPSAKKVTLRVASNGNSIGSQDFRVRNIPLPDVVVYKGRKPADEKNGYKAPGPPSLFIKAEPEAGFAEFLPKDARYKITEYEVVLARGRRAVVRQTMSGTQINLASFRSKARAGDRYVIEVKKVKRMNFQGNVESVPIGTVVKTIPLTD